MIILSAATAAAGLFLLAVSLFGAELPVYLPAVSLAMAEDSSRCPARELP